MLTGKHTLNKLFQNFKAPLLMGILNVTPDSFSDGNNFFSHSNALEHAKKLIDDGADFLDIGGESSRPGSGNITETEELARVIPVIESIRKFSIIPISVDTRKALVAENAIEAGANIINDISASRFDNAMLQVLAANPGILCIVMHMQGDPSNMQDNPEYSDVVQDIKMFFGERIKHYSDNGISSDRILIDPGIGFGKTTKHNLVILNSIDKFKEFGLPLVIGASRKKFISDIVSSETNERIGGSLAVAGVCLEKEVAIIRAHDIKEHVQYFKMLNAIKSEVIQ